MWKLLNWRCLTKHLSNEWFLTGVIMPPGEHLTTLCFLTREEEE